MASSLNVEQIIERAHQSTGLDQFDSDSFMEGLEILVADMNGTERSQEGVDRMTASMAKLLGDRLKVTDYLAKRPDLLARPVERPVFVFGIPRTGTTLLSNLLATDPARRSPLAWEIDDPVPPASGAKLKTDPRALARLEEERVRLAAHPEHGIYYRSSAIYPNECMFFIGHDFKALMWESRGKLKTYRDWLFNEADLHSSYIYHRKFLQLLQADAPGVWNLKMPSHALWLDSILDVYPDARFVWAHRDPLTATGSFCSIITLGPRSAGVQPDYQWIGENCSWQAVEHAERIMNTRDRIGEKRIIDVHYADLMRDPVATMRSLYAGLGDPFTAEAEAAMRAWLADNPQQKFGKHEYRLAEFGLTPEALRPRFERYLSRYHVEAEG